MQKRIWIILAVVGIVLILWGLVSINLFGVGTNRFWGRMSPAMKHGGGFGFLGWIGMLSMWLLSTTIVVLVVLGIFGLIRGYQREKRVDEVPQVQEDPRSPREISQFRYPRGEITREQYLQMLEDLS